MLPVLLQIFRRTIDDIIMPAYSFDEEIEAEKPTLIEQQAEYIAKYVIKNMDGEIVIKEKGSIDDEVIINSIYGVFPNIGYCTVTRGKTVKKDGIFTTRITISAAQKELKVFEKVMTKMMLKSIDYA